MAKEREGIANDSSCQEWEVWRGAYHVVMKRVLNLKIQPFGKHTSAT